MISQTMDRFFCAKIMKFTTIEVMNGMSQTISQLYSRYVSVTLKEAERLFETLTLKYIKTGTEKSN